MSTGTGSRWTDGQGSWVDCGGGGFLVDIIHTPFKAGDDARRMDVQVRSRMCCTLGKEREMRGAGHIMYCSFQVDIRPSTSGG